MVSNINHVSVNKRVKQRFVEVTRGLQVRENLLVKFLENLFDEQERANEGRSGDDLVNAKRVLVFVKTQRDSDKLAAYLCMLGFQATSINGARKMKERERSLYDFYDNREMVLVSTDVMARGVDVKDLDHVVNFTMPHSHVVYVHRIGRTGRVKDGFATSFFDPNREEDQEMARGLVKLLEDDGNEVPDFIRRTAQGDDVR